MPKLSIVNKAWLQSVDKFTPFGHMEDHSVMGISWGVEDTTSQTFGATPRVTNVTARRSKGFTAS
jgi:hypothetical protein